ncbi:hypothetical protein SVIO_108720 [Streptomyces violaceusniger]|uniref:Major facilitator superfamily (MFS) profile domain-containing protein n=1 Tax=Streptomyces violaceusniger TaxID=68280 RepID=A0A4D4LQW7_STRVO|nr:hypothetical protein SVIO_108720 [Streptomyces violaceusniger]
MSTVLNDVAGQYRPAIVNKVKLRLVPFLALLYVIAFIDRADVGYAALGMNADLGISQAQFGLIAGLFSIGYFVFAVPSNMLMRKVGARRWIARILFSWGAVAVAVATDFVHNFTQLAIARVILGVAEAGFFPCVILYLSYWFPERERARVVAQFMVALPVATLIAGPLSGLILDHVHWFGVSGWRWVFIIEGLPAVLLGLVTLFLRPLLVPALAVHDGLRRRGRNGLHQLHRQPRRLRGPLRLRALQSASGGSNLGLALVAVVLIISGLLVVRLRFVRDAEATLRAPTDTDHDRTPTPAPAADTSR